MIITYVATCDQSGCAARGPEAESKATARTAALEAGWQSRRTSTGMADFCPEHDREATP